MVEVAHWKLTAGNFGCRKTHARLFPDFTWQGVWQDATMCCKGVKEKPLIIILELHSCPSHVRPNSFRKWVGIMLVHCAGRLVVLRSSVGQPCAYSQNF